MVASTPSWKQSHTRLNAFNAQDRPETEASDPSIFNPRKTWSETFPDKNESENFGSSFQLEWTEQKTSLVGSFCVNLLFKHRGSVDASQSTVLGSILCVPNVLDVSNIS